MNKHYTIYKPFKGPHKEVQKILKSRGYKLWTSGLNTYWYKLPHETESSLSISYIYSQKDLDCLINNKKIKGCELKDFELDVH